MLNNHCLFESNPFFPLSFEFDNAEDAERRNYLLFTIKILNFQDSVSI